MHSYAGIRQTTGGDIANRAMRSRIAANKFRVTDPWASWNVIAPFRYLADVLRRFPTTAPDVWFESHRAGARKRAP